MKIMQFAVRTFGAILSLFFSLSLHAQGFYFETMHDNCIRSQSPFSKNLFQYSDPDDDAFINSFYEEHGWRSGRIVGGNNANIEDYPWHVALLSTSGSQICAGTILSSTWILTAAHCSTPNKIRAGVTDKTDITGQDRFIVSKINHPLYSPYQNDIALIQLASPLDLSDPKVSAIPIITAAHAMDGYTDAGVKAVITGWGRLSQGGPSTNILQVAELPLVSNEDAVSYGWYAPSQITTDMLCAGYLGIGGTDACQGDSGGPLVVPDPASPLGFSVAGVTSWGVGCARPAFPGVWARVSHFDTWIESQTGLSWSGPQTVPNPSDFEAIAAGLETVNLNWDSNLNDDEVLLVWSETPLIGAPGQGSSYNTGDTIPGGGVVIYTGNSGAFEHSGLEVGAANYYKVWSYDSNHDYSIGREAMAITACSVFTLPFFETFENSSDSKNCWTQLVETGPKLWSFQEGAAAGSITSAYNGERNARFTSSNSGPYVTKLVSPVLDLRNFEDIILSFWYAQEVYSGDQNELRLYYKTGVAEPWIQLVDAFTGNIDSWTQVLDIALPNPSQNYQIAFEGTDNWGYANVIDDIVITGTYTGPPVELDLQDLTFGASEDDCFAATENIYVAGNGTNFIVEEGGSVTLVAGEGIHLNDGVHIQSGGYLHAFIDLSGDYCNNSEGLMASTEMKSEGSRNVLIETELVYPKTEILFFQIYPNPTNGLINVAFDNLKTQGQIEIAVYGTKGERISSKTIVRHDKVEIDLSSYPSGIYIVRVTNNSDSGIKRIIKY